MFHVSNSELCCIAVQNGNRHLKGDAIQVCRYLKHCWLDMLAVTSDFLPFYNLADPCCVFRSLTRQQNLEQCLNFRF